MAAARGIIGQHRHNIGIEIDGNLRLLLAEGHGSDLHPIAKVERGLPSHALHDPGQRPVPSGQLITLVILIAVDLELVGDGRPALDRLGQTKFGLVVALCVGRIVVLARIG